MKKQKLRKQNVRTMSIWVKLLTPVIIVVLGVCILLSSFSYMTLQEKMIKMGQIQAQSVASLTATILDAKSIGQLTIPGEENSATYKAQQALLISSQKNGNVLYLYTLYTDGSKVYYGVDADVTPQACKIGDEFELSYQELKHVFDGEKYVEAEIDSRNREHLLTAYTPIKTDEGKVTGILACDFDASTIVNELNNSRL